MSRDERRERRQAEREQAQRTAQGLCSRCAKKPEEHPAGRCPDGLGSFAWAMDRRDMETMVERLGALKKQAAQKPALTRDEQTVLDALAELTLGSLDDADASFAAATLLLGISTAARPTLSPQVVAENTGLPLHHVRVLLDSLVDKGMIERGPLGGAS